MSNAYSGLKRILKCLIFISLLGTIFRSGPIVPPDPTQNSVPFNYFQVFLPSCSLSWSTEFTLACFSWITKLFIILWQTDKNVSQAATIERGQRNYSPWKGSSMCMQMTPYQKNMFQEFQVSQGTFCSKAQGSLSNFFTHIWVIWCLLRRQNNISTPKLLQEEAGTEKIGEREGKSFFITCKWHLSLMASHFCCKGVSKLCSKSSRAPILRMALGTLFLFSAHPPVWVCICSLS